MEQDTLEINFSNVSVKKSTLKQGNITSWWPMEEHIHLYELQKEFKKFSR